MITLEPKVRRIMNFFDDPEKVIAEARRMGNFSIKGAAYQGFESENMVPDWISHKIIDRLNGLKLPHFAFYQFQRPRFRLALEGQVPPIRFPHTDGKFGSIMPQYSLIIYLSEPAGMECLRFYENDTFGRVALMPGYRATDGQEDMYRWKQIGEAKIEKNMAILFPSQLFHMPCPDYGRGQDVDSGRLIIPMFVTVGFDPRADKIPDELPVEDL